MDNPIEYISIPLSQYNSLYEDSQTLADLRSAGVDNWEGYDIAMRYSKKRNNNVESIGAYTCLNCRQGGHTEDDCPE